MNQRILAAVLALVPGLSVLSFSPVSHKSERSPVQLAQEYMTAYEALDWEKLAAMYAEDVTWQDPTSAEIGANGSAIQGRNNVIAHLKAATAGISKLDFELPMTFHSAGFVVSAGTFSYSMPHRDPSRRGEEMRLSMDTVIVLELDGERIRAHTDYADFEAWGRQYQEQR